MNKTKSELYNELILLEQQTKLFPKKYIPFDNLKIINCVEIKCLTCDKYSNIIYNKHKYHICFDEYLGWHIIYPETLELCSIINESEGG